MPKKRNALSTRHCEEPLRRSNPDCLCGGILDCFRLRQGFGGQVAALAMTVWREVRASLSPSPAETAPHPNPLPVRTGRGRAERASAHFILHLSWKRSWSFSTMVATVFSESWPSASLTTSWR
ncbi:MAG: hypothetical protein EKK33_26545 [Bradyrhizobiaceae bacterium]|nr:MAG: hypothetical protein EKK33_26545 [Bradyrhizobiaceae bacterium]